MKNRAVVIGIIFFMLVPFFSIGCSEGRTKQMQQARNLTEQLESKDPIIKIKAILEIEKIKDKQSLIQLIPALINALDDTTAISIPVKFEENPRGKEAVWVTRRVSSPAREAAAVLKKISGKDFGEDTAKWQEWWEKNKMRIKGGLLP